jgi:hypothetical protein
MFQMNPYQSLTTMLILLLLVVAVIWLFVELSIERKKRLEDGATRSVDAPLAVVTDIKTRRRLRHLALVPEPTELPSPALYDWKIQGL